MHNRDLERKRSLTKRLKIDDSKSTGPRISVLRRATHGLERGGLAVMTGNLLNTPHGMYQTPNFVNQRTLSSSRSLRHRRQDRLREEEEKRKRGRQTNESN